MIKLKEARKQAGLTQCEVSKLVGISQTGYSDWETGKNRVDSQTLHKLAKLFGVTTDYLLGNDTYQRKGVSIPVYGDVAAGLPIEATENIVDYEEIDAALAATGEFFGLRVRGGSMEPRIKEGDVVIVRKQEDADTGDTVIALVNGDSATVKRIKKEASGLSLIPNNPTYDIMYYSADDVQRLPVRIVGKVVELRGKF